MPVLWGVVMGSRSCLDIASEVGEPIPSQDVPAMLTRGRRVPTLPDTYSFHCTACDSETKIKDGTPEQIAALQREFDEHDCSRKLGSR